MVDVELYGGRRGLLEHARTRTLYALGAYRTVRDIEWEAVQRVVFVCKGNICRSPYACAKARSLGVQAISFGLDAADGAPADPAARQNGLLRGMDLSGHRSARLAAARLAERDLVIVFEPKQIIQVRRRIGYGVPTQLLGICSRPVRPHIQDPFGMSDRYFQQCFSVIDASIAALVGHMARSAAPAISGQHLENPEESAVRRNRRDGMLG